MFQPSIDKELSKKLVNQPSCQMQYYPGIGKSINKEIKEGFYLSSNSDSLVFNINETLLFNGINNANIELNNNNFNLNDIAKKLKNNDKKISYSVSYTLSIVAASNVLKKGNILENDIYNAGISVVNAIKTYFNDNVSVNNVIIHSIGTTIGMIMENTINKDSNILDVVNLGFKIIDNIFAQNPKLVPNKKNSDITKAKIQCAYYILSIGLIIKLELDNIKKSILTKFANINNKANNLVDTLKIDFINKENKENLKENINEYIDHILIAYMSRKKSTVTLVNIYKTNDSIARVITGIPSELWNSWGK
jgi:hypothetical protein